ncbi:MAG: hypothetical protein ACFE0Q_00740 [Anaerolineae bacterium]
MSLASSLTWRLLIISLIVSIGFSIRAQGFEPVINMLGFTTSTSSSADVIEWTVTFSNIGEAIGQNIVISDTVGTGLQIESVQINQGSASINGRTVTISLPMLNPDESVQFTILTTVVDANDLSNTACVTASNLSGEQCVRGLPVQALPATGETPYWRQPMLWLGVMSISVTLLMIGLGMLAYRSWRDA